MSFRLALIQMRVEGGEKRKNLSHALSLIETASGDGADVVLLPEAMDLGWTDESSRYAGEPVPGGMPFSELAEAASDRGVLVCAGLTESDGGSTFNSAVLIGRDGALLAKHRKINELPIGHPYYGQGNSLSVTHTDVGAIGLMICADGFASGQVLSRSLGYLGADLILSPGAWAVDADHDHDREPYGDTWRNAYGPVARDFSLWIAGVSNVGPITSGPWAGKKCIGCSLVIGPDGRERLLGPYGETAETILHLEIDPIRRPARGCGWAELREKEDGGKVVEGPPATPGESKGPSFPDP